MSAAEIFAEYLVLNTSTNESIVGVFGVSKISIAGDFSPLNGATLVTIASTFAAYPQALHRTYVSSPVGHGAKNSSDFDPPIAPLIAETMLYLRPNRSKVFI